MSALLQIENLTVDFEGDGGRSTRAVDGISLTLEDGKTLALVGESGSGKSVTALAVTRLLPSPPARYTSGRIAFEGVQLLQASDADLRRVRGKKIAYVFQEPSTSLNPVHPIGRQIAEGILLHRPEVKNVEAEVIRCLEGVGIRDAASRLKAYPHEFSGGMQQRVMIAMALACQPKLLIADEPTTALDVTIQAQILELLRDVRARYKMSILLITHNFGIVSGFADEVAVMFRGKIVERGATSEVLKNPQHPYTKALIACVPKLGERRRRLTTIDYAQLDA